MEGMDNSRAFKTGGLPRHSFVEDPFFRSSQTANDMFRDIGDVQGGRRFGSNPRLFDDEFFENFARGNNRPFGDESSFFRSSLPRRPMNNSEAGFRHPPFRQQTVPHARSPSQPPLGDNSYPAPPPPSNDHANFSSGGPFSHQRQSSSGSNYDNFPSMNRSGFGGSYQSAPQQFQHQQHQGQEQPEKVHVIHVKHEKQPRDHHASNSNIVEINNGDMNAYTNGKLNPDRRTHFSNTPDEPLPKVPVVCVEDYTSKTHDDDDAKDDVGKLLPAISAKPIPLPPPESSSISGAESAPAKLDSNTAMIEQSPIDETKAAEVSGNDNTSTSKVVEKTEIIDELNAEKPTNQGGIFSGNMNKSNAQKSFGSLPMTAANEQMLQLLDNTERRVEQLREIASQMEQEKESILDILNNIKVDAEFLRLDQGDQEDLTLTTDRLFKRCKAVDVVVNTPRNEDQERALCEVNAIIDAVITQVHENVTASREKMERFLNACSPDEPTGPIDQRFQMRIVECTADDQKKIRRRLAQLIEQMQRTERKCFQNS